MRKSSSQSSSKPSTGSLRTAGRGRGRGSAVEAPALADGSRAGSRTSIRERRAGNSAVQASSSATSSAAQTSHRSTAEENSQPTSPASSSLTSGVRSIQTLKGGQPTATTSERRTNAVVPTASDGDIMDIVQMPGLSDDTLATDDGAATGTPTQGRNLTAEERASRADLLSQTATVHTRDILAQSTSEPVATIDEERLQDVAGMVRAPIVSLTNHTIELLRSINQQIESDGDTALPAAALPDFSMFDVKNAVREVEKQNRNVARMQAAHQNALEAFSVAERDKNTNEDTKKILTLNRKLDSKKSELRLAANRLAVAREDAAASTLKVRQVTQAAVNQIQQLSGTSNPENAKTAFSLAVTLADINGIPVAFPDDPTPQIDDLKRNMRTEDRTRIGFEIEVGQKYDFGRDTDTGKLEQIVNQTLYKFTPVNPDGTHGEPILEMVLDDVKNESQYPTAQIEFRTTPQDFESLNADLKTNIDDAISSFPQQMTGEEVRTARGIWQPTQLTEDNVQVLRTARRLQGRLTAKPVQHATVSIELNAFTQIKPEQKALLYTQGAGANNEAQLTSAISAHTGNDGIDATTTGRNNAGIMVKTPVEAILAVRPDLSVTPASGVKGLRQMREQEVSEVQITRTAQYMIPKTATATQLIRILGFPGIQGEHGIGYRAIAEKLQPPLLDTVSGGTRVLVEHRGNSEGSLAYKVNAALNGHRDPLDTVRDAARAMDTARQRPAAAATSSTSTAVATTPQEPRTRPDEPLNNPAAIARQVPPRSGTLATDPTTPTENDMRDVSARQTTSPPSPSSSGTASGSGSRSVRQLREGSRTGNSGNL